MPETSVAKKRSRHDHSSSYSKIRWADRSFKPKQRPDRFTYRGVKTEEGKEVFAFFISGKPFFEKCVGCTRDEALSLVRKLNRIPSYWLDTKGQEVVDAWLASVKERLDKEAAEKAPAAS